MGWEIPKASFYGTRPTTGMSGSSSSGKPAEGMGAPAFDLTRKQPEGDRFSSGVKAETNQYKAEFQQELQQQYAAKEQQQAQLTANRDLLKRKMDDIKAERARVTDPIHDRQKLTKLDAEESQARSDDRLAYFEMGNNYSSMLSNSLSQTKFVT